MLKPNYVVSFNKIVAKIIENQTSKINSQSNGIYNNNSLNNFNSILILDCIDDLQSDSENTELMNNNLNTLQLQWTR